MPKKGGVGGSTLDNPRTRRQREPKRQGNNDDANDAGERAGGINDQRTPGEAQPNGDGITSPSPSNEIDVSEPDASNTRDILRPNDGPSKGPPKSMGAIIWLKEFRIAEAIAVQLDINTSRDPSVTTQRQPRTQNPRPKKKSFS